MATILITGANRGLGLELCKQYAEDGWSVLACCRMPDTADGLHALQVLHPGKIEIYPVDITDVNSLSTLSKKLRGRPIDVLFCCAGIYLGRDSQLGSIDYDDWMRIMNVNVFGTVRTVEAFSDNVCQGEKKTIALMSSLMGSIADNGRGGSYLYRSSKAALNMVGKNLAKDFASKDVNVGILHPGWVETDMGGPNAPIKPSESVEGMRRVLGGLTSEGSGKFFDYRGRELAW